MSIERSSYYTNNTVNIKSLIQFIVRKWPVVILAGIIGTLIVSVPWLHNRSKVINEIPCYYQFADIYMNATFEENSMLMSAEMSFADEYLEKAIALNGLNVEIEDARLAMPYRVQSKNVIRYFVYGRDRETVEKMMNGLITICAPVMAEECHADSWRYDLVLRHPKEIKVNDFINDGNPGLQNVQGAYYTEWDIYCDEATNIKHLIKKVIIIGGAAVILAILCIALYRLMSEKLFSLRDIEGMSSIPVLGVTGKDGRGAGFIADAIGKLVGEKEEVDIIPITTGKESLKTVGSLCDTVKDYLNIEAKPVAPISTGKDVLSLSAESLKILVLEDEKVTESMLKNAVELLELNEGSKISLVVAGVSKGKLKHNDEYFGKYYS